MTWFPEPPELPDAQNASGPMPLRYEDVAQDGRVLLTALPTGVGEVVWNRMLAPHVMSKEALKSGILPILTRLVIEGRDTTVRVDQALEAHARYELAHTVAASGAVDRLLMNYWVELTGLSGRTHGPKPADAGTRVPVGRVYAEHVFTKPFGPPSARKVTEFDLPNLPKVPPTLRVFRPLDACASPPDGARMLDPTMSPDDGAIAFGLMHTDSNQHVNSLVYLRMFEEAALRRLAAHGRSTKVLARSIEIGYRKPCFAGDRVRIHLRAFVDGTEAGAIGAFVPEADPGAKPHCWVQVRFRD